MEIGSLDWPVDEDDARAASGESKRPINAKKGYECEAMPFHTCSFLCAGHTGAVKR